MQMLSHIVAACQIESDRREKEQSSCYANATDDNLTGGTLCSKKRKASSSPNVNTSDGFADFTSSEIVRQVKPSFKGVFFISFVIFSSSFGCRIFLLIAVSLLKYVLEVDFFFFFLSICHCMVQ